MSEVRGYKDHGYDDRTKKIKEIINGKVYYMAGGTSLHAKIISRVIRKFNNYFDSSDKECEVYTSDLDIFLDTENETNYVEPDISIICDDSKFFKNGYKGVPELIVEVASRATRPRDRGVKFKLYEKYGVKEYWLIEPKLKSIEQYVLIDGRYDLHKMVELLSETEFNDLTVDERESYTTIIKSTIFNDLEINLNEIILKADKETDKD